MLDVLLWVWQLPQNIIGLFMLLLMLPENSISLPGVKVFYSKRMRGGISLGNYIIVRTGNENDNTLKHEWGHSRQSRLFGPLYLLVIGIPSLLWAAFFNEKSKGSYYDFYTEKWADKLGGVVR